MDRANHPQHGGNRRYWAERYGFHESEMVDLSTGINPHGWSVPAIPAEVWQRLPESDTDLLKIAADYYGTETLLPVAGSQAAIQTLPRLRTFSRVAVLDPSYSEHMRGWELAGHEVLKIGSDQIESLLPGLDVLVLVNPNNPTGELFSREELLRWHQQLADRGGWLVVDEAFMDATPEHSLCMLDRPRTGLIILRSLGKFFGLAGIRSGFVFATPIFLERMERLLGPWSLSHPAQWATKQVLCDHSWQSEMRDRLVVESGRLSELLRSAGLSPEGGSSLFQWLTTPQAAAITNSLAEQGVLIRLFKESSSIRFGLPGSANEWERLESALSGAELLRDVA
ncbi:MAG: threonine-phosphate decarboxylase [Gammaproteobacteria bacterium]|uniref:threonine-phosphate decarboxylase n=1 Tax=Candidatus Thiopontia autotrophica TaxID=2841688 RepID=A0A8J6TS10_9GAMM|nr:threonine-phosphate decarboxylase [Candidatus Thiopontia autotrophica]MBL6968984.1 threonine-phosphate decarboxylase [Gammaproteobacteria bacterium]